MRVLIGCERSGVVRRAFRERGHDAWSCDLVPADDDSQYHLQCDVLTVLGDGWDLAIFHPDCTYLANSGVLRLYRGGKKINGPDERRWSKMREAAAFFKLLLGVPVKRIAVENPVMHGHAAAIIGQRHNQSIQPYQFGEDASKRTCLWLRDLPKLKPTTSVERPAWIPCPDGCDDFVCVRHRLHTADCDCPALDEWVERGDDPYRTHYANQTPSGQNKLGPSPTRPQQRAQTYPGIAAAMADQWGGLL